MPLRDAPDTWQVGNVEAGFKEAALVIDETVRRTPATPDMIVASLEAGKRVDAGLTTHV